jgi:hypothetical protein
MYHLELGQTSLTLFLLRLELGTDFFGTAEFISAKLTRSEDGLLVQSHQLPFNVLHSNLPDVDLSWFS